MKRNLNLPSKGIQLQVPIESNTTYFWQGWCWTIGPERLVLLSTVAHFQVQESDCKINEGGTLTFSQCKNFINVIIQSSGWSWIYIIEASRLEFWCPVLSTSGDLPSCPPGMRHREMGMMSDICVEERSSHGFPFVWWIICESFAPFIIFIKLLRLFYVQLNFCKIITHAVVLKHFFF